MPPPTPIVAALTRQPSLRKLSTALCTLSCCSASARSLLSSSPAAPKRQRLRYRLDKKIDIGCPITASGRFNTLALPSQDSGAAEAENPEQAEGPPPTSSDIGDVSLSLLKTLVLLMVINSLAGWFQGQTEWLPTNRFQTESNGRRDSRRPSVAFDIPPCARQLKKKAIQHGFLSSCSCEMGVFRGSAFSDQSSSCGACRVHAKPGAPPELLI